MSIIENALKKAGSKGLVNEGESPIKENEVTSTTEENLASDQIETKSSSLEAEAAPDYVADAKIDPEYISTLDEIEKTQTHFSDSATDDNIKSADKTKSETKNGFRKSQNNEKHAKVNWTKLAENGFLDNNETKSKLADELRIIKRPLVNNVSTANDKGIERANLILITSSLPGEGKTFIAINLALSIANERDKNVLLIDADVANSSVTDKLGIKTSQGLIEYLENDAINFTDIVFKTDLPNFSVIPAGKRHQFSTELLASDRMNLFADEISERYKDRIIIFDSPPLLLTTQSLVLAQIAGQIVLVVEAETTPQNVVSQSVSKLANCDVVITLLNKTRKEPDLYGLNIGYGKYGI